MAGAPERTKMKGRERRRGTGRCRTQTPSHLSYMLRLTPYQELVMTCIGAENKGGLHRDTTYSPLAQFLGSDKHEAVIVRMQHSEEVRVDA